MKSRHHTTVTAIVAGVKALRRARNAELMQDPKYAAMVVEAGRLGAKAFADGKRAVPCLDSDYMALIKGSGLQVGDGLLIVEAWNRAWHQANADAPVPREPQGMTWAELKK